MKKEKLKIIKQQMSEQKNGIIKILTVVNIVLALSVLVLMVVSDAVLEPLTTTLGTVRQLRLPPADLK